MQARHLPIGATVSEQSEAAKRLMTYAMLGATVPTEADGAELATLADLLDSCEPDDDQPVTWGALRRQVRKASEARRKCSCNADAYSLNPAEVVVHSLDGCRIAPALR